MADSCENCRFYDETATCKKCGHDDIHTHWCEAKPSRQFECSDDREPNEHICRRCIRCGFSWNERPLDARPDQSGEHQPLSAKPAEGVNGELLAALKAARSFIGLCDSDLKPAFSDETSRDIYNVVKEAITRAEEASR